MIVAMTSSSGDLHRPSSDGGDDNVRFYNFGECKNVINSIDPKHWNQLKQHFSDGEFVVEEWLNEGLRLLTHYFKHAASSNKPDKNQRLLGPNYDFIFETIQCSI